MRVHFPLLLAASCLASASSTDDCPQNLDPFIATPSPFGWPLTPSDWDSEHQCWENNHPICGGARQSPMDIDASSKAGCEVPMEHADGMMENCTHYVDGSISRVKVSTYLGTVMVEGHFGTFMGMSEDGEMTNWDAVQVHLTADSWHTIEGEKYDAEMIIFHKPEGDKDMLASAVAVSLLFQVDESNSPDSKSMVFEDMGFTDDDSDSDLATRPSWSPPSSLLHLGADLAMAVKGRHYLYEGSIPVPPCPETVDWLIMHEPKMVTKRQLDKLMKVLNSRVYEREEHVMGGPGARMFHRDDSSDFCRAIEVNGVHVGADHEMETCMQLKESDTWRRAARCWDFVDVCWNKHWSPVDVITEEALAPPDGESMSSVEDIFHYESRTGVMVGLGKYALEISTQEWDDDFGHLMLNGHIYYAKRISVRAISQHTINGERFDGELIIQHLMYGDDFGEELPSYDEVNDAKDHHTVMVSIPLKLGDGNNVLSRLNLDVLPDLTDGKRHFVQRTVDLAEDVMYALDESVDWYWYSSNSTDKGCGNSVRWMIFNKPLDVSLEQLNFHTSGEAIGEVVQVARTVGGLDSAHLTKPVPQGSLWERYLPDYAVEANETECTDLPLYFQYGDFGADWAYGNVRCWAGTYPLCKTGTRQSPIDIPMPNSAMTGGDNWLSRVNWRPVTGLRVSNTGHNLQINSQHLGYSMLIGSNGLPDYYEVAQFHLHMPSEHLINGKQYAAEIHVVHQKQISVDVFDSSELLVMGFMFDVLAGEENQLLNQLFLAEYHSALNETEGYKTVEEPIDLMATFGPQLDGNFYHYSGSLTTPPCSEDVKWFVFETPQTMSLDQWQSFKQYYHNPANNRPVQKVNDRAIYKNSFQESTLKHYDMYLSRYTGRDRPTPPHAMILFPIIVCILLALATMAAVFVRDDPPELNSISFGGLVESDVLGKQRPNMV